MRHPASAILVLSFLAVPSAGAIELSTGFLIGPRHDPRAFYVRANSSSSWQKSYTGREYRKEAQGRMVGVTLPSGADQRGAAAFDKMAGSGLLYARILLQDATSSSLAPDGTLKPAEKERLKALLARAGELGVAVELVIFHPGQDQNFEAQESFARAVTSVTDWLIDCNSRHVLINPAGDWTAPGWDWDSYVPQHIEQFTNLIRDRFQQRRTDFALPIALAAPLRVTGTSKVVQEADVIIVRGDSVECDPRTIERPIVVQASDARGCGSALTRFSGCIVEADASKDTIETLAPFVRTR